MRVMANWIDNAHGLLESAELRDIDKARSWIEQEGKESCPEHLISALNFGFWRYLLTMSRFIVGDSTGICWTVCESCRRSVRSQRLGSDNVRECWKYSKVDPYKPQTPAVCRSRDGSGAFDRKCTSRAS